MSIDGVSNNAYEYVFLAHSGTRSQSDLNELEHERSRERLVHGRSVDQYVEMNKIFDIAIDGEEEPSRSKELFRGKSEDLDIRKRPEPVAITSMYENMIVKQQNPKRKLRRNPGVYEEYDFQNTSGKSPASEHTFVSSAYILVNNDCGYKSDKDIDGDTLTQKCISSYPLSPTHYQQPPTPDHPPPSAIQAESVIHERIRPLSQVSL